jgi:site-specific DNA recombinase
MFELYASGNYSLSSLQKTIKFEFGQRLAKGYLERLLKNSFYIGLFIWEGKTYTGTHMPLITVEQFEQVQNVFRGRNKPKYRKHDFAFRGLLTCAYDNCLVTAEIKKAKYIYYRCTQYRGKCALPYFREEELGNRLGQILKDIHIPDDVFASLQSLLLADRNSQEATHKQQEGRLQERLALLRRRAEQIYLDKLDGRVSEELWRRKSAEWQQEEQRVLMAIQGLKKARPDSLLDGVRILELANKAYFLYLRQPPAEKAKLLKLVLSNCTVGATSIHPTYKKPFDLIFARAKNEEWCARRDSNSRPSASKFWGSKI